MLVSAGILYIKKLVKSDKYIKVEFKKLKLTEKSLQKIMQNGTSHQTYRVTVFAVANIVSSGAISNLSTTVIAASRSAAFNAGLSLTQCELV